jgi:hypothetical protein
MQSDSQRYLEAIQETGFDVRQENLINEQVRLHQDVLTAGDTAATLGILESDLTAALGANLQGLPAEVANLRQPGGVIHRETFDAVVANLVTALGLGTPLTAN